MPEIKINNLSGRGRFFKPIFRFISCGFPLFSFTKYNGIKERKAKIPAVSIIDLKLNSRNQNKRKNRRGAYWEDRYHATAVETDKYLLECAVYIDLNMVRAGVVNHPAEWKFCGYQEILGLKKHKFLIDKDLLCSYFCIKDPKNLGRFYRAVIEEKIMQERSERESRWTDAIAVGSKEFTERFKQDLGIKARKRDIRITGANQNGYQIRESEIHFLASKS